LELPYCNEVDDEVAPTWVNFKINLKIILNRQKLEIYDESDMPWILYL